MSTTAAKLDDEKKTNAQELFSGAFNKKYYVSTNSDLNLSENDAMPHYLEKGWQEGRNPNQWFSVSGYLEKNPDVAAAMVEPLTHYLSFGRAENRTWTRYGNTPYEIVSNNFDIDFYLRHNFDIDVWLVNPIEHYIVFGWLEGRNPAPWFSVARYLGENEDVRESGIEPFYHYLMFGRPEGRRVVAVVDEAAEEQPAQFDESFHNKYANIRAEFDDEFYALCYPDMADPRVDRFEHFMVHGWRENRNPAPWFSTKLYLDANPDVEKSQINPFIHYIMEGRLEDRPVFSAINNGSRALKLDEQSTLILDKDLLSFSNMCVSPINCSPSSFDPNMLNIHWVIPDFSPGSGGHSTIFRIIRWLEFFGHQNTVWLTRLEMHKSVEHAYDDIVRYFQPLKAEVKLCGPDFNTQSGDAVIATGWQTVANVSNATGFLGRFYFVQDFEPAFYPIGSQSICAEMTYHIDLGCICASRWLSTKLNNNYGRWVRDFKLAYDSEIYFPAVQKENRIGAPFKIAVYARSSTARRCVELALIALEKVAKRGLDIHVTLFAADIEKTRAPYPCTVYGVMAPNELADLYRSSDLGICFSATNYSLVPQEMMACGLPVLELDGDSARATFPEGVVKFAGPSPNDIADQIEKLITSRVGLVQQIERAFKWIRRLSWSDSAKDVRNAINDRLRFLGHTTQMTKAVRTNRIKASVCIPTYNGGDLLLDVIETVKSQETPWSFDIIVVDSQSNDGTSDILSKMDGITFKSISQAEFGHGKTRNLCAQIGRGEYIAFLTQDAKPQDKSWLYNMVSVLEHFTNAAGAFGRHVAHKGSSVLTEMELNDHFKSFETLPLAISRQTDLEKWGNSDSWRQLAHFFSDNNSCLRRSVWEKIPYPEIEFGEDQVWAKMILDAGFERLYVPCAVVSHSHDYSPVQIQERAFTEAAFFKKYFGYELYDQKIPFERQLSSLNANAQRQIVTRGLSVDLLERKKIENRAVLEGRRLAAVSASTVVRRSDQLQDTLV